MSGVRQRAHDPSSVKSGRSTHAVFIDARVPDLGTLLRGVTDDARTHVLAPDRDGLAQISEILAADGLRDLAALSIVAHGAPGVLHIGATPLDAGALQGSAPTLARIGAALGRGGSVLIYACDLARGETGASFVADLSNRLGAQVAAASHPVGASALGGRWELDASIGHVAASNPFNAEALAAFHGLLVQTIYTWVTGGVATDYNDANNWTPTVGAPPDTTDEVGVFANTGSATVVVNAAVAPDAWEFAANAQSYTISGATVTFGGTGLTNLQNTGSLISVNNVLAGSGGVTQNGSSNLSLAGANTYTGTTTITAGTLRLDASNVLPDTTALTVNGATATLNIVANNDTVASALLQGGGTITGTTGALTSTAAFDMQSGTASAILAGTAGLNKTASGTVTLSGVNTYTGATSIDDGVLSIGADANLGAAPGAATPDYLTFDGGTLQTTQTFALNANRGVTFNAGGGTIETASGTTLTYGGIAAGAGSLTKTGTGDLLLAGANTYSGTTTVSAGTLRISNAAALGATGPASATTVASGATLSVEGGITTAEALTLNGSGVGGAGALTGTGNSTVSGAITLGTGTPTVGVAAGPDTLTLAGNVGGTSLTKVGAGTLSLTGVNNYSGATNVNAGVLSVSGGFAIPDASAVTVASGALLNLQVSETIGSLAGNTPATGGTVQLNASTLTTGGDNTGTAFAGQITGVGGGALIKEGAGIFTLSGNNTYDGLTQINAGTLVAANAAALGSTAAGTNVANGATLTIANASVGTEAVTLNGGTALTGVGTASLSGAVMLNASSTITADASDTLTLSGVISGAAGLTKAGTGTLVLSNPASTYTGNTVIAGGILAAADSGSLGNPTTFTNTLLFDGPGATLRADGIINSSATRNVTLNSAGIIDTNGNSVTIAGVIDGPGGLTKVGAGILTLSNANTYGGLTSVIAGTLLVNGSIAASATVVNSAATLGGTNGTLGVLNVASGGTFSPGASAGILTAIGAVTFIAGANFNVEIGGTTAGVDYDRLVAGDSVALADATLNASLLGSPVVGTEYKIIDKISPGAVSGIFNGIADGSTVTIGGQAFQINYAGGDGNDVTLTLGALKISGTDPIAVLADVNTTTIGGPANSTSPTQSVLRTQALNGDINGTVNPDVTIDGWGLSLRTTKSGGAIEFINNGTIVVDDAAANNNDALSLLGNGGGVHYSGTGSISNDATNTPDSGGMLIASLGGIGGNNLIEVGAGSTITADLAIVAADGTTTVVVSGAVTGTNGTAIFFGTPSFNNIVDLKPTAVITGNLDGSGNDDTVRLSGTSGSGTFDLSKINGDFSNLVKAEAATWTVTGTLNAAVSTVIINGTLLVNGTVGTVLVTDGFGDVPPALLGGTGTVGNVIVQHAGILAPGASAGTLTSAGNVTLSTGSTFRVEIGGTTAGTQYDLLHLSGTGLSGLIDLGDATIQASLIGGFTPTVGQVFKIIDNDDTDAVANTFAGMSEGAGVLVSGQAFRVSYVGGDGNDVTLTAIVGGSGPPSLTGFGPSIEIEQAGPAAVPQILDSDVVFADAENNFNSGTLVVSGLLAEDTVSVPSTGFDPGQFFIDDVAGPIDNLYFEGVLIGGISGGTGSTLSVTFNANATANAIDALIQNLTYVDLSDNPTFSRTLSLNVTDSGAASTGPQPLTVKVFNGAIETGTSGDDSFTITGNAHINAGGGDDTVTFGFRLVDATVSYTGNHVIIDGPSIHTVLSGFEKFAFTDGTVNNNDGSPLIDDLFYFSKYHDVWNAHADADAHYNTVGWHENRDPDAFFSTSIYLSANPDVKAAGVNPLDHFDTFGWHEGRVPAINFDPAQYLVANPDVAAANVDPLRHFLQFGAGEGRLPFKPTELVTAGGFDFVWYLDHNPDVAAAGVDPLSHFETFGWHEGRDPNALFDVNGYLANYADVAAAGVNPLDHYNQFGWHEGRDPSVDFDTTSYLAAYPDVAAAGVNPLAHFLHYGIHEGRSPFADSAWG